MTKKEPPGFIRISEKNVSNIRLKEQLKRKLTRYKYYPVLVSLNESELESYLELTFEIGKCVMKLKNGKIKLNKKVRC